MPLYAYRYMGPDGPKEALLEAESEDALLRALRERGIIPMEVRVVEAHRRTRRLPPRLLSAFFRQLKSLMRVGDALRLDQALALLEDQLPKWARKTYAEAPRALARGTPLPQALGMTGLFPNLVIATLRVADSTGKNEEAVERLAAYYTRVASFQAKLRSALTYPALILVFALLVTWGMMTFIVPQFVRLLQDANVPIPLPTKITIFVSQLVSSPVFMGALFALGYALAAVLRSYTRAPENRLRLEAFLLRVPVLGPILIHSNLADMAGTLKLAYESGIALHEGMTLTRGVVSLEHFRQLLSEARENLIRGMDLSGALAASQHAALLPPIFKTLISVGETGGSLDEMLDHAEQIYAEEVETTLSSVGSVIEPLLLVFVGVVIGGIMLSVLLPYFSLVQSIGGGGGPGAP